MKILESLAALVVAATLFPASGDACTRAVYRGPDGMTVTGRTMDWKEELHTNLYVFPRGIERRGGNGDNVVRWTSRYGSIGAAGYDIGIADGMNEKGLVANLLFLPESSYERPGDNRPVLGLSIWTQYVLDNFATVDEAVEELRKERFRIDAPDLPGGVRSRLHLAVSDASGDSAIFEYIDGHLHIYHSPAYQVLTNSPAFDKQLAVNAYWKEIGGLVMLPGTNRSSDRFVRASFYIDAVEQTADPSVAVATVFSVMRSVSVPFGISTPDKPYIASTRWRSIADQKQRVYYYEATLVPSIFWIDLSRLGLRPGTPVRKLPLSDGQVYTGEASAHLVDGSLTFLFEA